MVSSQSDLSGTTRSATPNILCFDAKGGKDRVVMQPHSLAPALRSHVLQARTQWEAERRHHLIEERVHRALKKVAPLASID